MKGDTRKDNFCAKRDERGHGDCSTLEADGEAGAAAKRPQRTQVGLIPFDSTFSFCYLPILSRARIAATHVKKASRNILGTRHDLRGGKNKKEEEKKLHPCALTA